MVTHVMEAMFVFYDLQGFLGQDKKKEMKERRERERERERERTKKKDLVVKERRNICHGKREK